MPALIVALDGVLADTPPLRAHALADACVAESRPCPVDAAQAVLPGLTFLEAAMALFPVEASSDPTLPELVALRAQRAYGHIVQHGVPFRGEVLRALQDAAARGVRVVIRADSERRDVEPLLAMAELDHLTAFVRCSDDLPNGREPSLLRSWRAIDTRLDRMQQSVTVRTAWETSRGTSLTAESFVAAVRVVPPLDSH
jgi:beta-phosphoglucomutase-like phosphatase (HAD superfamily)